MKWCRFQAGQQVSYGIVEDDQVVEVAGSPFAEHTVTRTSHALGQVKLLPPVIPPMLYAAGPNYRGHVEGMARRRGAAPIGANPLSHACLVYQNMAEDHTYKGVGECHPYREFEGMQPS